MEITWFGRSTFRLRGRDATVVTDPPLEALHGRADRILANADLVTLSAVGAGPRLSNFTQVPHVVHGPGEYEVKSVSITGIDGGPRQAEGAQRDVIYLFDFDDLVICHLGLLQRAQAGDQADGVSNVDVLFVPVGNRGKTLDASAAAEVIGRFEPRVIVPMCFKSSPDDPGDLDTLEKFAREMGVKEWEPQPRLNVTRSSLPAAPTTVVLAPRS